VVLYMLLSGLVASGMFIGWLCFHGKRRSEFSSEAEIVLDNATGHVPVAAHTTTPH
jgi:inositol transporter-like SP family MFS transporter